MLTPYRLLIAVMLSSLSFGATPVIFDTDMGNDVDDALALAMLHTLTDRGECRLIGVTLTNASPSAVPYIRMVNRFYGRASLPVGVAMKTLKGGADDNYPGAVLRSAPAQFKAASDAQANSSVAVLRQLLASSQEKVTIVQVGFSTNLALLLDSKPDSVSPMDGMALVKAKVSLLSTMAGDFANAKPEYNVKLDIPAAQAVFERWPTPVVFSGYEVGNELLYPAESILKDFGYVPWHPVAQSYRAYHKMPYNRPTWDLTAVLQAVRGSHGYFSLSEPGKVHVGTDGVTKFETGGGDRRYLRLDPAKRGQIVEALSLLSSEPPLHTAKQ